MDREIAPEVRRRRITRRVITAAVALAAISFFFAATVEWLRPSLDRNDVVLATVKRGAVEATLEANGTVVPLVEQVVASPVEARVLRVSHRAGDVVKSGDELLTLDTAATQLEAMRLDDRMAQKRSSDTQLRLQLEETIASLRAQLEQKKLDAQIVNYNAQQKSKLRSEGLIAEQDALAANAMARKSEIELQQLQQALARAERSRAVQLSASQADLSMTARDRDESRRQLELAMLRADRNGVLTSIVSENGSLVRRGDVIARIADLSSFRVEATISDVHAARLAAGQRARVTLDGAVVGGRIESVDPRIVSGVVKFSVVLDQPSHPRLRNNQRVDVTVVAGERGGALMVSRGALARTDTTHAFVVRGNTAVRVPVQFGLAGREQIEILSGLREGEQVVISDMSDYEDVSELKLN